MTSSRGAARDQHVRGRSVAAASGTWQSSLRGRAEEKKAQSVGQMWLSQLAKEGLGHAALRNDRPRARGSRSRAGLISGGVYCGARPRSPVGRGGIRRIRARLRFIRSDEIACRLRAIWRQHKEYFLGALRRPLRAPARSIHARAGAPRRRSFSGTASRRSRRSAEKSFLRAPRQLILRSLAAKSISP